MSYEQKPGQGSLFKNDKTGGNPNWPDYRGSVTLPNGEQMWLDAWIKDGKKGKFMSLSIKPKQAKGERTTQNDPKPAPADDFGDSEIPF